MRKIVMGKYLSLLLMICVFTIFIGQIDTPASEVSLFESEEVYSTDMESSYLLSNCEVVVENIDKIGDEYVLMFTLSNESDFCINNWSIVFESNYIIKEASDVEIIEQSQIKHIKCLDNNKYINNGDSISFEIRVFCSESITIDTNYRVYGSYDTSKIRSSVQNLERKECLDIIQYDMESGEYSLEINDVENILKMQPENVVNGSNAMNSESLAHTEMQVEPYSIIGNDNRNIVSNVRATPYSAIVFLEVTYFDGSKAYGTGFAISDYYLATAAHMVHNAQKIVAYLHLNGMTYDYRIDTSKYAYCASYPSAQEPANDWAVVEFEEDVGNEIGRFLIGYTTYDYQLSTMNFTICGFPGDMAVTDPNGNGIGGKARYMYYASSAISGFTNDVLNYTADTYGGQSGSPVYNTQTYTVYGIHVAGGSTENCARRFTKELYNLFVAEKWID